MSLGKGSIEMTLFDILRTEWLWIRRLEPKYLCYDLHLVFKYWWSTAGFLNH
jgi:hypothetical protein